MEPSAVGDVGLEVVDIALGVVPDRQAEALLYGRLDAYTPCSDANVRTQPHDDRAIPAPTEFIRVQAQCHLRQI
jgi:hypothetical protein